MAGIPDTFTNDRVCVSSRIEWAAKLFSRSSKGNDMVMKSLNLFGEMQDVNFEQPKKLGKIQKIKQRNGFRIAPNKTTSCRFCKLLIKVDYHGKTYYKCDLIGTSHSEATDIRLKNTCNKFEHEN